MALPLRAVALDELKEMYEPPSPEQREWADSAMESFLHAMNTGEPDDWIAFFAPDGELTSITAAAEGTSYTGHEALRRYNQRIREAFEQTNIDVEETLVAGDVIVQLGYWQARGRGSGIEIDSVWAGVNQLRDGLAVWVHAYTSHEQALRVGLERAGREPRP